MREKSTTSLPAKASKPRTRNQPTAIKQEPDAPTLNAEVALLLSNIMAHPMLPNQIFSAIGEALTELENNTAREKQTDSVSPELTPEHIERVLNARDGLGFRAFGLFKKERRTDGYARFALSGFDGEGRR